jgi:hypothetical protein
MFGNDERFHAWYNIVYQYRSRGEHETYEKLIAAASDSPRRAQKNSSAIHPERTYGMEPFDD